jgi:hypothetical protein
MSAGAETATATLAGVLADLAGIAGRLPAEPEAGARILDRLAEELTEAAAMIRALPGRPAEVPGYTFAALAALDAAVTGEHDFAGWLAACLATIAARRGGTAALTEGRPGSWEAALVGQLVFGTAGYGDEALDAYRDGAT